MMFLLNQSVTSHFVTLFYLQIYFTQISLRYNLAYGKYGINNMSRLHLKSFFIILSQRVAYKHQWYSLISTGITGNSK